MIKSKLFTVVFDENTGGIQQLTLNADKNQMNYVKKYHSLNKIMLTRRIHGNQPVDMNLISFIEEADWAKVVWRLDYLEVETEYSFTKEGNMRVSNRFHNLSDMELLMDRGEWGIAMPFADEYPGAKECMTNRCHTHIWCGLSGASYVCCLKMGLEKDNIGLFVTEGGFESYSQEDTKSNDRGWFLMHPDIKVLSPENDYVLTYEIFPCEGKEDFLNQCSNYDNFICVNATSFSIFEHQRLQFAVQCKDRKDVMVTPNTEELIMERKEKENQLIFSCKPEKTGEYKFGVQTDKAKTVAVFQVLPDLDKMVQRRVEYIVDHQQFHKEGSHLDGAYLVYDNKEKRLIHDNEWPDCNASRERVGMGILVAHYLQSHKNDKIYDSLKMYEKFIRREIYDDTTGRIFDVALRDETRDRLYNYLWVALFYAEMYRLTNDEKYLDDVLKIVQCYYKRGGMNHYPNAVFFTDLLEIFYDKRPKEYETLKGLFLQHASEIIKKGSNYPKHEVNYEQTIVAPAVAIILDAIKYGDKSQTDSYMDELMIQTKRLERFDGFAPHYKLNEVAIRYWDAYWFGKSHVYGDTLPHYWSCLSSANYFRMGKDHHMDNYVRKGQEGLKACLCTFFEDGSASCASVFPYKVNGVKGEFMDAFANDQDFALYYGDKFLHTL